VDVKNLERVQFQPIRVPLIKIAISLGTNQQTGHSAGERATDILISRVFTGQQAELI
jgi:hypothetical protein